MTWVFVLLILQLVELNSALRDQQEVRGKLGQNVSLGCIGPRDAEIKLFTWTKNGSQQDYVFFYRKNRPYPSYQDDSVRGRVYLREASGVRDGDFSVVLLNLSMTDAGTYMCRIVTQNPGGADGEFQSFVHLRVSGTEEEEEPKNTEDDGTTDVAKTLMFALVGISVPLLFLIIVCFVLIKTSALSKCRLSSLQTEQELKNRTGLI